MHTYRFGGNTAGTVRKQVPACTQEVLFADTSLRGKLLAGATLLCAALTAPFAAAQIPAVVSNSTTTLASGFSAGPAVTDACGNVYVYESGGAGIVRIEASTGKVTTVIANQQGYQSSGPGLYMDVAKKNLYFNDFANFYTAHFDQVPITNCAPGAINANFGSDIGSLTGYYYGTVRDTAGDAAGNVYFVTTAGVQTAIYKEAYSASAATYAGARVFNWTNNINWLAADAAGDLFFVDSSTQNVYALMLTGGAYPATPTVLVPASRFNNIAGLSLDPQGNLYIADGGASLVFEVPLESGALNPAHVFATAAVGAPFKVAVDASHNLYLSNYSPGAAEVAIGSTLAPSTNVGSTSGSFMTTYLFNAATTPTGFSVASGTSGSSVFALPTGATGACSTATAQAALSTCTVSTTFTPTAVGQQTGALSFVSASGTVLTNLSGVGAGPVVTIDPGTVDPFTTALVAPAGIALDSANNIYVTDTTSNTLSMFTNSSSAATTVSTGALMLKAPKGVAIDANGDIFIADTGNNRIVEIPAVGGMLMNASTVALSTSVKAPQAVAIDRYGNLLIADTGDNTLLMVPSFNGALNFGATITLASGLGRPSALALDPSGNLYVTESTNNDLLKFAGPVGSAAGVKVASGFSGPTGVATDASGAVLVVDSGTGSVVRYPVVNGVLGTKVLVGGDVVNPIGVAADTVGNLYVTDTVDDSINQIKRVTAALQFGGVNVGSTGTQSSSLNSSGNVAAVFSQPDYTVGANSAPGFAVTGDTCAGATVAPGTACSVTATYSPTATQLNAEEDLTFAANGVNGKPVLQLIGTGARITPSTLSLALTNPTGTISAAQSVTFTATVGVGANTAIPGGSVKFSVSGAVVGTVAVKNNTAAITLKNGLPAGNGVVVSAVYSGDVINYSSSSAQLQENVVPLSDGITLTVVAPYGNPYSAIDNSSVIAVNMARANKGLVTATLPRTTTLVVGSAVSVTSSANATFNGGYTLLSVTNVGTVSTITWQQGGGPADATAAGSIAAREVLAAGPTITLTATVAPSSTLSPGGTVSFYAGTTLLGVSSVAPGTFQATMATTALRAGTGSTIGNGSYISNYNLTAVYSGDTVYAGGTSNTVPASIVAPPFAAPACALTGSNGAAPTCLLNTTGGTFSISLSTPAVTVASGQTSGSTTLTVTTYGGWSGVLQFTCSGLPKYASCNPFPGTPLVNSSTAAALFPLTTVIFTVQTDVPPAEIHTSSLLWWLASAAGLMLLVARRRVVRLGYGGYGRLLSIAGLLLILGGSVAGISGCSAGSSPYLTPSGMNQMVVTVHAAQLVPGTTTGQVQLQDGNVPSLNINLVVQ